MGVSWVVRKHDNFGLILICKLGLNLYRILSDFVKQTQKLGFGLDLLPEQSKNDVLFAALFHNFIVIVDVDEIASFAVQTTTIFFEILALLGFVFIVYLVIFEELVRAMGKFAASFVGAEPIVHIAAA